ncbi:MAG: histidine kinase dimerization/phospho-acceptor domain-containing protein, partial [Gemmatimonadales bacterium]
MVDEPMMGHDDIRLNPQHVHQLTRLSRAFTDARSLDDILELAVEQAAALLGAERAVLMLPDSDGQLSVRAVSGIEASVVDRFRLPANESLVARLCGMLGSHVAKGFVGVPLVTAGRVVGLLATVRADGTEPTAEDEWLLSSLADQVAAPLENARLARQLESTALLADNVRLYEAECAARIAAEAARSEAERSRDAAIHADTSKTAFLAAMSHELRTPLNAIAGYVQLLEMEVRGPITPQQAEYLNRIKASQAHLLRLISDVLDYARLGAGQTDLAIADVDVDAVIHTAEVMVMPQIHAKELVYSYERCATDIMVRADPHRVQQILINLLTNSVKYTVAGGSIHLSCEVGRVPGAAAEPVVAILRVRDTGPGIPADRINSMWQP